mmetsp:Transcript_10016/g.29514  ORF Transcript_10016/g.29514 Transcript_10016/m.29514 type:complete len:235 (-) Transcript_10016:239-943(-)
MDLLRERDALGAVLPATVELDPLGHGIVHGAAPVRRAASQERIHGVRGAVEREDRHRPRGVVGLGVAKTAERGHGREDVGALRGQARAEARPAREAGAEDAPRVQAQHLVHLAQHRGGVGDVVRPGGVRAALEGHVHGEAGSVELDQAHVPPRSQGQQVRVLDVELCCPPKCLRHDDHGQALLGPVARRHEEQRAPLQAAEEEPELVHAWGIRLARHTPRRRARAAGRGRGRAR